MIHVYYISVLLLVLNSLGVAQNSYISNGGFENYSLCPNDIGQIDRSNGWFSPSKGTSDFFHDCSGTNSQISIGQNIIGYQLPFEGAGMAGIMSDFLDFSDTINPIQYREYLCIELNKPLEKDVKYQLKFHACLGENSNYAISQLGASFTIDRPSSDTSLNLSIQPQIINNSGFLLDTLNWQIIEGEFIAMGGENYMTIGLFSTDVDTFVVNKDQSIGSGLAYYFIDGISFRSEAKTHHLVFSPNSDNINDTVDFSEAFAESIGSIKVFSRWGKIVYSCNDSKCIWDGYYNNNPLPQGTYYYVAANLNGDYLFNGTIHLY